MVSLNILRIIYQNMIELKPKIIVSSTKFNTTPHAKAILPSFLSLLTYMTLSEFRIGSFRLEWSSSNKVKRFRIVVIWGERGFGIGSKLNNG